MYRIFFLLLLFYIACNKSPEPTGTSQPSFDFSTPDNAVKSFWKFAAWEDTTNVDTTTYAFFTPSRIEKQELYRIHSLEKARKKYPSSDNTLTDVQVKSESYAIVEAREYNSYSDKPTDTRYILSRQRGNWKIDDCQHKCYICDGTGMQTDYEQQLKDIKSGIYRTNPKKECTECKATGWKSFFRSTE